MVVGNVVVELNIDVGPVAVVVAAASIGPFVVAELTMTDVQKTCGNRTVLKDL